MNIPPPFPPSLPSILALSPEVYRARATGTPIVALESTVITHGLPSPENMQLATDMENEVRTQGATPATIAILDGQVHVGMNDVQLERLSRGQNLIKVSSRDIGSAVARAQSGGTTVAATMAIAHCAGIKVFATGGIGGVHRDAPDDVSADLTELSRTPVVVVCAGAKAILDLPATLEMLETLGVPVIGYGTDNFPAFYSVNSGLKTSSMAATPEQAAKIARSHWELGLKSAILVTVPPPEDTAMPKDQVEEAVKQALKEAREKKVKGQAVTPFLLKRVSELTHGDSLRANLALLRNNARVAASIARYLSTPGRVQNV